tara:strand:+ start:13419 stop:13658 length:240 start_codon:yes stop_codon:yes gene_type:complete
MNNVQFQDQQNVYTAPKKKGLEQMIIKMGLAKDSKGAQMVLLIIAVVAILIGGFFAFSGGGNPGDGQPNTLPEGQFIPE